MGILGLLGLVAVAGAIGGLINALVAQKGFVLARIGERGADRERILLPGVLGNVFLGACAAMISWGLYGPLSSYHPFSSHPSNEINPADTFSIGMIFGAALIGAGGARWLSDHVDKQNLQEDKQHLQQDKQRLQEDKQGLQEDTELLRDAATTLAAATGNQQASQMIMLASPAEALGIARQLAGESGPQERILGEPPIHGEASIQGAEADAAHSSPPDSVANHEAPPPSAPDEQPS